MENETGDLTLTQSEVEIIHLLLVGNSFAAAELAEEYGWLDENGFPTSGNDERLGFERKMERLGCTPPWEALK